MKLKYQNFQVFCFVCILRFMRLQVSIPYLVLLVWDHWLYSDNCICQSGCVIWAWLFMHKSGGHSNVKCYFVMYKLLWQFYICIQQGCSFHLVRVSQFWVLTLCLEYTSARVSHMLQLFLTLFQDFHKLVLAVLKICWGSEKPKVENVAQVSAISQNLHCSALCAESQQTSTG